MGLILSEIWEWGENVHTSREDALGFGRGLQAINILRNHDEDLEQRGVNFYPPKWEDFHMMEFAKK